MKLFPRLNGLERWLVLAIGAVVTLALVGYVAVYFISTVQSVPVTIFNDIAHTVIITDCGSDLTQIDAGQSATLSVYKCTRTCSVDGNPKGNVPIVGCVHLPSPLNTGLTIRISVAERSSRSRSCP